jgi:PAS domain S-box-containing protein
MASRPEVSSKSERVQAISGAQAHRDALAKSDARFLDLIESLDVIIWEMDVRTWRFTYVSPQAEALLGYPVRRWLEEPGFWQEVLLHSEDREWALEFCQHATREARDHEFEYRARHAHGGILYLRDLVRVVPDPAGDARLLRGVMIDVTQQKKAEAELRDRERNAALTGEIGNAIADAGALPDLLQRCAEALVRHLGALFARIWTLNESEQVLELQASAGRYTHLDGAHSRVPVGALKIGRIAAEKQAHLTNDVPNDPRISDKEWARREGMVAFAGYPLLLEGRVLGVVAVFAREPLTETTLDAMRGLTERLALVIDRKRTEQALYERERQLIEAQQIAHLGSWEWDVAANTVLWSDELYRIYGLQPERGTATFEGYLERVHPEDRARVKTILERVYATGEPFEFEERIVRPNGEVRVLRSRGEAHRDGSGRTVRLIGVCQDVTELRQTEERERQLALAEAARERVTAILESITDAFFAVDRNWCFTYVNREAERLLQRPRDELLGGNLWREFPDAVGSIFERQYRRAMSTGVVAEFEEFFEPLAAWFEVHAYPSADGLSVYFRNVTERRRTQQALRHQSELTRTITDNATAGLFMMDVHGRCTFMNPAAEEMIGFTLDEIRDIALHDAIHHHHPDGRPFPLAECPIDRALPEQNEVRRHEDVFIRMSGEFFPVVCAAQPIIRDGEPIGTVIEVRDVTEEKQAELALRESEERFRSLIEATTAIVWTTPASGEFETEQPQWSAFTGQSFAELRAWGWLDAIHPDDRAHTARAWEHALEERSPLEVEQRLRRYDGEYRHMQVRGIPILDTSGQIREWVGIHTDITERKLLEQRQRFLVEAGKVLSSSLDYEVTLASLARLAVPTLADWCAVDVLTEGGELNRVEVAHTDPAKRKYAFELQRRYPPDSNVSFGVPHVLRTGQPQLIPEISEDLLARAATDEEHLRILRALGLASYVAVPLIARGRTLGVITLVSAQSGRRYAADDLQLAQELAARAAFAVDNARLFAESDRLIRELHLERTRLASIFEQAPAFIATLRGAEHVFEMANSAYYQLIGQREIVGKPVREALPELEGQGFFELLDRVYASGESFVGSELKITLQPEPGAPPEERYLNFVYQPVVEATGATGGIFVHGVDVTAQVRARREIEAKAEELAQLAEALERSNRELDQFAYVTSHDLKAPLRGIANLAQWVEEDLPGEVPAEVREHLQLLKGRVNRMEALIDGILQYSRAGRVTGEVETVDTGALAREAVELLDPPETVEIAISPRMPVLRTERLPLQQVFSNLIGNAVKYLDRPDGCVAVDARQLASAVEFRVADNGPGIAPEYHERIFGIFQTLHARDKVEGTGIGLSLVKKIVEHRGGRVWVESAAGEGATFRFTWPLG